MALKQPRTQTQIGSLTRKIRREDFHQIWTTLFTDHHHHTEHHQVVHRLISHLCLQSGPPFIWRSPQLSPLMFLPCLPGSVSLAWCWFPEYQWHANLILLVAILLLSFCLSLYGSLWCVISDLCLVLPVTFLYSICPELSVDLPPGSSFHISIGVQIPQLPQRSGAWCPEAGLITML